jgi:hypothetical protein
MLWCTDCQVEIEQVGEPVELEASELMRAQLEFLNSKTYELNSQMGKLAMLVLEVESRMGKLERALARGDKE